MARPRDGRHRGAALPPPAAGREADGPAGGAGLRQHGLSRPVLAGNAVLCGADKLMGLSKVGEGGWAVLAAHTATVAALHHLLLLPSYRCRCTPPRLTPPCCRM